MFKEPLAKAYPAVFHVGEGQGYFIEFPDFPDACIGTSERDEALGITTAEDLLGIILSDILERGGEFPKSSPVNSIEHKGDDFVTLIRVDIKEFMKNNEPVMKTITLPKWANDLGERIGLDFSQLMLDAIANTAANISYVFDPESLSFEDEDDDDLWD